MSEWNEPGWGWSSSGENGERSSSGGRVRIVDLGKMHVQGSELEFTNLHQLLENASHNCDRKLRSYFQLTALEVENLQQRMKDACLKEFSAAEIEEVILSGGCSNGRQLQWNLMLIDKNMRFNLHSHPNIEIIYVLFGSIHEYRLLQDDEDIRKSVQLQAVPSSGPCEGPDLSTVKETELNFVRRTTLADKLLLNPIGSIHLSFTKDSSAVLLVCWGGAHANITDNRLPAVVKTWDYR